MGLSQSWDEECLPSVGRWQRRSGPTRGGRSWPFRCCRISNNVTGLHIRCTPLRPCRKTRNDKRVGTIYVDTRLFVCQVAAMPRLFRPLADGFIDHVINCANAGQPAFFAKGNYLGIPRAMADLKAWKPGRSGCA